MISTPPGSHSVDHSSGTARSGPGPARAVALINQKGGVGKTTTAVNLAAAVAARGRSTLLVDMDPQAHATLHLGVDPAAIDQSVYHLLLDPPGPRPGQGIDPREVIHRPRPQLALLPAQTDLAAAESELAGAADRHSRLARALDALRSDFEFIFIDCPPSLGLLTLNALAAAREIIVPMQAQFLALQGVGKLLETVSLVSRGVNHRIRVSGVVLCMHEEQTRHAREVVADIRSFFAQSKSQDVPWRGAKVYQSVIRRNIKLAEAPSFGQSIMEYAETAPGAEDYRALAEEMIGEWDRTLARLNSTESKPAAAADPSTATAAADPSTIA